MDLGLIGRRALVLGGGRGLGFAVATALAREGALVALVARGGDELQRAAEAINAAGNGRAIAVRGDLVDWNSVSGAVTQAEDELGGSIEILLNNSGGPPPAFAVGIDAAVWRHHFETMVLSYCRLADRVLPSMRKTRWGRIINVASTSVLEPIPQLAISNALRASVIGWAKTLATEVAGDGVTVNTLLPGRIETERIVQLDQARAAKRHSTVDEVQAAQVASIPLGRAGSPAEFGAVAAFIASDKASYVTGTTIRIDGGAVRSV